MPPLNQISKEEIEKFTENFGNRPIHHTSALGGHYQFPADEIRNSHLRLIDGIIEHLKGVNIYGSGEDVSYKVTRERIRQIEVRAFGKLKVYANII